MIPYGRQSIDDEDIAAVAAVLKSDFLTQGPAVEKFEAAFAAKVGAQHAVAVNSGTAALHAAVNVLDIGPGDEVIVPAITFTATANCVVFQGATPVFADVDPTTGLMDPRSVEQRLTERTEAIIAVDYAGHPCDYDELKRIADSRHLCLVADACHAPGAEYKKRLVGSLAPLNTFSFHPVKHVAAGEGGMITTDDEFLAFRMREFRSHGITRDPAWFRGLGGEGPLAEKGPWYYEMVSLGFNYRMSDINCALGASQLKKLDKFVARRREIASRYNDGLRDMRHVALPRVESWARSSWHLYPLRVNFAELGKTRTDVMNALRSKGIGTQVHYIPVYLQPFYRAEFNYQPGLCPNAEKFYAQELSIPMYPAMKDDDVDQVIQELRAVLT